jgi:hypothetical protein
LDWIKRAIPSLLMSAQGGRYKVRQPKADSGLQGLPPANLRGTVGQKRQSRVFADDRHKAPWFIEGESLLLVAERSSVNLSAARKYRR